MKKNPHGQTTRNTSEDFIKVTHHNLTLEKILLELKHLKFKVKKSQFRKQKFDIKTNIPYPTSLNRRQKRNTDGLHIQPVSDHRLPSYLLHIVHNCTQADRVTINSILKE